MISKIDLNHYQYIYKTEAFEPPTIFHVNTVLKKKLL